MRTRVTAVLVAGIVYLAACPTLRAADAPSVELALKFRPVQKDVEYETPKPTEYKQCKVKVERRGKSSGWVVTGPSGQLLRRFSDTNGDNVVDQWSYFNLGLEVYRDIDSNFNNKVDQSRWLNTGGSRWGIDANEDGQIDSWKVLSAEEASRVAVQALVAGDGKLFQTLMLNADDVRTLGIVAAYSSKLLASAGAAGSKVSAVVKSSKSINSQTKWMRFDSSMPSLIPQDEGKANADLTVYENAMVIAETGGQPILIQIGEMIRVGDVWKMTQVPQPLEGNSIQITQGGILMQPVGSGPSSVGATDSVSKESQKLLSELQELDRQSPTPADGATAIAKYNSKRADLLTKLIENSTTDEERVQWTRQIVDGLAAAVQSGGYPEGVKRLQKIQEETVKSSPKSPLVAYVSYRRMLADYSVSIQKADGETRQKVQEQWLANLTKFVENWSKSEDAPEAMLQLAISQEFSGKLKDARKWYDKLVADYSDSQAGIRATGAVRRLELKGKPLDFSGEGLNGGTIDIGKYRGKVVLVLFWATWCKPCTEDLPQIRALYEQYHDQGFEIVGVNLDVEQSLAQPYLTQHRVTWPQIYEPGGLGSGPAKQFGIISLPTMFVTDTAGKVLSRNVSVMELKTMLADLLKKK